MKETVKFLQGLFSNTLLLINLVAESPHRIIMCSDELLDGPILAHDDSMLL